MKRTRARRGDAAQQDRARTADRRANAYHARAEGRTWIDGQVAALRRGLIATFDAHPDAVAAWQNGGAR